VAEKPDGGSWAVVRYVPSLPTDKVEGEFPLMAGLLRRTKRSASPKTGLASTRNTPSW